LTKILNSLKRTEILRGYGVFEEVLSNSRRFSFNNLILYAGYSGELTEFPVKVGFLLSKKKLKKLTIGTGYGDC